MESDLARIDAIYGADAEFLKFPTFNFTGKFHLSRCSFVLLWYFFLVCLYPQCCVVVALASDCIFPQRNEVTLNLFSFLIAPFTRDGWFLHRAGSGGRGCGRETEAG